MLELIGLIILSPLAIWIANTLP